MSTAHRRLAKSLLLCLFLAGTNLFGASIFYTCNIASGAVSSTSQYTFGCNTPLFDLGPNFVLTGVTLTLSNVTLTEAEIDVGNLTNGPLGYSATATVPFIITGPGGIQIEADAVLGPINGTVDALSVAQNTGLSTTVGNVSLILSSGLDLFIGSGSGATFNFSGVAGGVSFVGSSPGPPSVFYGGTGNIAGTFIIEYDYTDASGVPEPATLLMAGGALVGLGLAARKTIHRR